MMRGEKTKREWLAATLFLLCSLRLFEAEHVLDDWARFKRNDSWKATDSD